MRVVRSDNGISVAHVDGDVDRFTSPVVAGRLGELVHESTYVVIDLSGVGFVDSAGLHGLFGVARAGRGAGRGVSFVLPEASPLLRVFEVVRLSDLAPVHRSVESALRAAIEEPEAEPSREGV